MIIVAKNLDIIVTSSNTLHNYFGGLIKNYFYICIYSYYKFLDIQQNRFPRMLRNNKYDRLYICI